jgi:hypothetical protein
MSVPEFLGTTIVCCADSANRTFYVWAYLSEMGEIEALHYGINFQLVDASGIIDRRSIDTDTRRKIWKFAEDAINEGVVIEPFDDTPLYEGENIILFPRRH